MSLGKLVSIEILTKKPSASIGGGSSHACYTNKSTYTSTRIKGIAGHEIGHAFGLDDLRYSWDYYKLMWYKTGEYRTNGITTDEIDWIRIIYSN